MIGITGATGFIGQSILTQIQAMGRDHRCYGRTIPESLKPDGFFKGEINDRSKYNKFLSNVDVLIHSAARVHVMGDSESDPLKKFREINTLGTLNLARQAAECGVKRFIFLSSIKVSGEGTPLYDPYKYNDSPQPIDPYGVSKFEAEEGLKTIALETNMEVVIIRPTLVYGPGVKANFLNMMKWLNKRIPLPFGAINNKRSLVALDNLVDLILVCIDHPKAANEIFLVSDDHDVSTSELLRLLGQALRKQPILLPLPMDLIGLLSKLIGKPELYNRLCGSLQVDISHTKDTLNWKPPYTLEQSLLKTANAFNKSRRS